MQKNLRELLRLLPQAAVTGDPGVEITGIEQDSRKIRPGGLFICLPGHNVDGKQFAQAAVANGAVAVLADSPLELAATVITVNDVRAAMSAIVPAFYDYPGKKLKLLGVTGTNGKTTTTYLLQSILQRAGRRCGVIGTIQAVCGDEILPLRNTTPDVPELQQLLYYMQQKGMEYVAMEVSSHALAIGRVAGCDFPVGIFTNLTQDHLDFHKTLTEYRSAKARLFAGLTAAAGLSPTAVFNVDDPSSGKFSVPAGCRRLTYGVQREADFKADDFVLRRDGMTFTVETPWGREKISTAITGKFNIYNILAAAATAYGLGIGWSVVAKAVAEFTGVAGRFELVRAGQKFPVIVDYAHTPDGLQNVLHTARELGRGKLIVVFGCGGDRDRGKRPQMGEIAARIADVVVITSDNPRTEDPLAIIADVLSGADSVEGRRFEKIIEPDRRTAIKKAVQIAAADDVVVIAGKGHETYQILADRTIDFDDRLVAQQVIGEVLGD
ncbi:MAG: UDP-N-acetylmuramoyl-L-alanyl-D-glutamate--2,6-diaminopimelate ligase [Negativicutes bacterium]|nr:UDP-N-acetylmuramoyl-L-alanyl-D-glutamate--2,6-diaminopimelate ligase [Negativicutes bacterium]